MLFLLLVLAVPILGYIYVKRCYSFWADRNVPYITPKFPFGNLTGSPKKHLAEYIQDFYKELKGKSPFGGIYFFLNPVMLVTDLDMIKNILVKDFNYFMNRGIYHNERDDPLSAHLFNIEGTPWRNLRIKLTPTFTSGKMKFMYPTIVNVSDEFTKCVGAAIQANEIIELKDIVARFTTDVIGTCAFGLDCSSLNDSNALFRVMGRKVFDTPKNSRFKMSFLLNYPGLSRFLRLKNNHIEVSEFFHKIVKETVEYREKNNIKRKDFMDLLIEMKADSTLSLADITAQCFLFFLAGFETSSTAMSYSLHELALNQEIQDKARNEVIEVLERHNGELTYEAMMDLKYLDQIINESLRKYPPLADVLRKSNKDYTDPITGVFIPKGTRVVIPAYAIQMDPEYYPNPEVFDPERFTDEMVKNRNPFTFLPFGEGPRVCIGLRFGMMQARVGLAKLLLNYKFMPSAKTTKNVTFNPKSFILSTSTGLWLKVEKIN